MAAAAQPRHWDPSIPHSSMASSGTASSRSFPLDSSTDLTSLDQFAPSTARNSHSVEDGDMSSQQWATLASGLGIHPTDIHRSSPEAQKFARKIGKQRKLTDKQTTDLLLPVITSVSNDHPRLIPVLSTTFSRDAVPLDHPSFIFNKTRLPTPRPAITLGYNPQIFHPHYRELMQGIISDSSGQPRNLDKISMTCPGTYWPFFAIEINNDSYSPSHAAASAAAATATCNNALLTLASVLNDVSNPLHHDPSFRSLLTKSISSFSLALSAQIKSATLYAHTTTFPAPYFIATDAIQSIKTYNLSNPADVESLASRLNSIFNWAETTRLLNIMDLLDKFDSRVQFRETKLAQETEGWGPMDVMARGQLAPMAPMSVGMGKGMTSSVMKGSGEKPASAPLPAKSSFGLGGKGGHAKRDSKGGLLSKAAEPIRRESARETVGKRDSGSGNGSGKMKDTLKIAPALMKPDAQRKGSNESAKLSNNSHQSHDTNDIAKEIQRDNSKERGRAPNTTGNRARISPDTPRTPESLNHNLKLTLNTAGVDTGVAVGANGKPKKASLFKTVISDALPAWTKVEI